MSDALEEYRNALARLKTDRPINVAKGTWISNDAVSQEAGRKKGTIKRSRPIFAELISEIDAAAAEQRETQDLSQKQLVDAKADSTKYRKLWEESLGREVSLVKQLWAERQEWANEKSALTGEKVSSIMRKLPKIV